MKTVLLMVLFVLSVFLVSCSTPDQQEPVSAQDTIVDESVIKDKGGEDQMAQKKNNDSLARATFAGGCFWCMEPPFENTEGVLNVTSGFSGGDEKNPSYQDVAHGRTGHREAIHILYDPAVVSYETLVDVFWKQINPTDEGGQFADRGFQYSTAIFYHDENQKRIAEASKKTLEESGRFSDPIVTAILPFDSFFEAEDYHQDYYKKNPIRYNVYKTASGRTGFIKDNWK